MQYVTFKLSVVSIYDPTSLPMCPKWQNEIKRSENRWMDWYKFYIIYTVYRKESNLAFWSQNISVVKLPWRLYTQHCRRMSKNMENIHTYSLTGNTLVFSMNQNSSGCSRVNQWASGIVLCSPMNPGQVLVTGSLVSSATLLAPL